MLSARKVSLVLAYLVSAGCFTALFGIADTPYFLILTFIFALGALNEWKFGIYLPRWLLNTGGVVISAFFLLGLSFENPVKPFANMLLLLLAIKSLEEKRPRDIYQMLLLSLFGIAVSTTFRLDISFLLFFLYELFLGSVAFMFTNVYANLGDKPISREFLGKYLRFSLAFPFVIGLATIPFFVLLPRTQTPLFDFLSKKEKGLVSGIADEVELGKVGEIQKDNSVAFRVYGEVPIQAYWRVSVFDTLMGTKWITTIKEPEIEFPAFREGRAFKYTIIIEPTYDNFLPLLDYPLKVIKLEGIKRNRVVRIKGGYFQTSKPISKPVRYTAISVESPPADKPVETYLAVPDSVPDSVRNLALEISKNLKTPEEKLESVKTYFAKGYSYTLSLSPPQGDPIESFLFKTKRGNCEFFASSTALLLRLMSVPARVVGGFKGYIKNDYADYYIVTNSMAHVWVEAYVKGKWVRVDTTPPYLSPAVREISKLDLLRDALISFWYENIVDFSAEKQANLVRNVFRGLKDLTVGEVINKVKFLLYVALGILLVLLLLHMYLSRIRKSPENLYKKLIRELERRENEKFRSLMPEELLSRLREKSYYNEAKFIVDIYLRHRFSAYGVSKKELFEGYRVLRKI